MRPLTDRQRQILAFIRDHLAQHGYAPTIREIASQLDGDDLPLSLNAVSDHLSALSRKGYLLSTAGVARSLRLTPRAEALFEGDESLASLHNTIALWEQAAQLAGLDPSRRKDEERAYRLVLNALDARRRALRGGSDG